MKRVLRVLVPLLVLAAGIGGAALLVGLRPDIGPVTPESTPPLVESVPVTGEAVQLYVHAQGTVVPRTESRITGEVSGRVVSASPSWVAGGFFEAADPLLEIDPTDYRLAEKEAAQRVAQAELRLEQEEAEAGVARRDWKAMNGDAQAPPLVVREPQVREARAALEAARATLEKARRDVERCRIVAPYAGRVRETSADLGTYVQPGGELGWIYATDAAEVRLPLPDAELAFVDLPLAYREGRGESEARDGAQGSRAHPKALLSARFAGRRHDWVGRIVRTEGRLAPESRMVVAVCRVADPYGRGDETDRPPLAVGMFVEARIEGRLVPDAITIPRSALRADSSVWVHEDDVLHIRPVELLRKEEDRVVLRSGLRAGERVITTPLETAVDGMPVRGVATADGGHGE